MAYQKLHDYIKTTLLTTGRNVYSFNNDTICLTPGSHSVSDLENIEIHIIEKMIIEGWQNVNTLCIGIVYGTDVTDLIILDDTIKQIDGEQRIDTLFTFNKSMLHLMNTDKDDTFLHLSQCNDMFIPEFIECSNRKLVLVVKTDNDNEICNLHIKQRMIYTVDSFWLLKSKTYKHIYRNISTTSIVIKPGVNRFPIKLHPNTASLVFSCKKNESNNDMIVDFEYFYKFQNTIKSKNVRLCRIEDDWEYKKLSNDDYDYYIINFSCQSLIDVNDYSNHITVDFSNCDECNLTVTSKEKCKLILSSSVLKNLYYTDRNTFSGRRGSVIISTYVEQESDESDSVEYRSPAMRLLHQLWAIPENNQHQYIPVTMQTFPISNINTVTNPPVITHYNTLHQPTIKEMVEKYEHDTADQVTTDEELLCIIDKDVINDGEYFYKCTQCNATYRDSNLQNWLSNPENNSCPGCRVELPHLPKLCLKRKREENSSETI